jgi:hypothetical protein
MKSRRYYDDGGFGVRGIYVCPGCDKLNTQRLELYYYRLLELKCESIYPLTVPTSNHNTVYQLALLLRT